VARKGIPYRAGDERGPHKHTTVPGVPGEPTRAIHKHHAHGHTMHTRMRNKRKRG